MGQGDCHQWIWSRRSIGLPKDLHLLNRDFQEGNEAASRVKNTFQPFLKTASSQNIAVLLQSLPFLR